MGTSITGPEPGSNGFECFTTASAAAFQLLVYENLPISIASQQPWRGPDTFHQTLRRQTPGAARVLLIDAELQAGRTGVEYECVVVHHAPIASGFSTRA